NRLFSSAELDLRDTERIPNHRIQRKCLKRPAKLLLRLRKIPLMQHDHSKIVMRSGVIRFELQRLFDVIPRSNQIALLSQRSSHQAVGKEIALRNRERMIKKSFCVFPDPNLPKGQCD